MLVTLSSIVMLTAAKLKFNCHGGRLASQGKLSTLHWSHMRT